MENLRSEEEKIIKAMRNLSSLNRELSDTAIKDIRNLFRLKKETKGSKERILRDIKILFEYEKEEENYYESVRVSNFWSNNYIEYKGNNNKNKILSVEEYLNKISPN